MMRRELNGVDRNISEISNDDTVPTRIEDHLYEECIGDQKATASRTARRTISRQVQPPGMHGIV
jgi:hypothetical protein